MPKYLCKTDLRSSGGALSFEAGATYTEHDTPTAGCISVFNEFGERCYIEKSMTHGWFHAFELVDEGGLAFAKEETYGTESPAKDRIELSAAGKATTIEAASVYSATLILDGHLTGMDLMVGNKSMALFFQVHAGESEEYEVTMKRI